MASPAALIDILNNHTSAIKTKDKANKTKFEKEYRSRIPPCSLENLEFICRATGDYLTVIDLEKEIDTLLLLSDFNKREAREAFLAQLIKIGELSSNKNVSNTVRKRMDVIPWSDLEIIRDCIEHQDENEYALIFENY